MTGGPRRTCVACRVVREKWQLVRLVRRPEGTVVVDGSGRLPGRGAYVCTATACATRLLKGGRLSQVFRGPSRAEAALVSVVQARERSTAGVDASGSRVS
jgi:predicted RNA-binding protein YlxR (DUF448 family)